MRVPLVLALFLAVAAAPAGAQNCANPQTQLEMNDCARIEHQDADRELNAVYKQARARLSKDGATALRDAQGAWITFRDKACVAEGSQYEGGSIQPLIVTSCLARLTRERTAGLRILLENN